MVEHLFSVASSLDSMVLGETQILGQVREAYDVSREAQAAGPLLHPLFQRAVAVGKQVMHETAIGEGRLSVASVAVDYAKQIFEHFDDKTVLCIGAGEDGRAGPAEPRIAVAAPGAGVQPRPRQGRGTRRPVRRGGGAVRPADDHLVAADIVVTSTGSTHPVITRARFRRRCCKRRRYRPIFLIDIAVPRDVEAAVGKLDNVYLYNLDDLQQVVLSTRSQRQDAVDAASAIVAPQVEEFVLWHRQRELGPTIDRLYQQYHRLAQEELAAHAEQAAERLRGGKGRTWKSSPAGSSTSCCTPRSRRCASRAPPAAPRRGTGRPLARTCTRWKSSSGWSGAKKPRPRRPKTPPMPAPKQTRTSMAKREHLQYARSPQRRDGRTGLAAALDRRGVAFAVGTALFLVCLRLYGGAVMGLGAVRTRHQRPDPRRLACLFPRRRSRAAPIVPAPPRRPRARTAPDCDVYWSGAGRDEYSRARTRPGGCAQPFHRHRSARRRHCPRGRRSGALRQGPPARRGRRGGPGVVRRLEPGGHGSGSRWCRCWQSWRWGRWCPRGFCAAPDEPHGYDVVEYHLQVPREWYEAGRIVPLGHNVFSYFPFNVETHYLLAMHVRGGPWSGMYLAQLMHASYVVLSGARGLRASRGRSPRRHQAAVFAGVGAASVPWLTLLAPIAYNEGGLLLYGTLALGWTLRAGRGAASGSASGMRGRTLALAGTMAGFACGAKLTAVPTVLPAGAGALRSGH